MTARARVRTVVIGTGEFGVPAFRGLVASPSDVDLVGVVSAPARPAGRHGRLQLSPVAEVATGLGLSILTPERLRSPDAVASILALRPDLIVLADYGQIVPPALLELTLGALNLHPSLLPRHRGAVPVPATILAGDSIAGVSLMRMDVGLDTGPIVASEVVVLAGDETTPELEALLAEQAADLLVRTLGRWIRGKQAAVPQSSEGATLTRQLRRDDGRLDPSRSVVDLERQIRAFQPWPGSWLETSVGRLVVWRARLVSGPASAPVGALRAVDGLPVLVAADGALELREVQPAGGTRMAGEEFVRGRRTIDEVIEGGPAREPIERAVGYSNVP